MRQIKTTDISPTDIYMRKLRCRMQAFLLLVANIRPLYFQVLSHEESFKYFLKRKPIMAMNE